MTDYNYQRYMEERAKDLPTRENVARVIELGLDSGSSDADITDAVMNLVTAGLAAAKAEAMREAAATVARLGGEIVTVLKTRSES